jgi:hypothetical protein
MSETGPVAHSPGANLLAENERQDEAQHYFSPNALVVECLNILPDF